MSLTVVIPLSQDRCGEALRNCIASLRWQTYKAFTPLLVVLETKGVAWSPMVGDKKGFRKWASDENLAIVIRPNPHKVWAPSLARNIGFRHRPAPFVASLDCDAVLGPLFLEFAVKQLERGNGVRASTYMCEEYPFWGGFKTRALAEKALARPGMVVGTGPGCFIGAPKRSVWKVRGWDEAFIGYGPTDWDFVYRLRQTGLHVVDLAKAAGQYIMHQNHERDENTRLRKYIDHNRDLFAITKAKKKGPARNRKGWGGKK